MDNIGDNLVAIIFVLVFFGGGLVSELFDYLRDRLSRPAGQKGLSKKDARRLLDEAVDTRDRLSEAREIMRAVRRADTAYPQLPVDVRDDLDSFLTVEGERTARARERHRELGR